MMPTREAVVAAMQNKGYALFVSHDFDLNIIGVRTLPGTPNKFDDFMCVLYMDKGKPVWKVWPCTTDPGLFYLNTPIHASGTAVLAPAQNRGAFTFGKHHGDYECLVQRDSVAAYLDANKDSKVDENTPIHHLGPECGIHIHHAGKTSTSVDKWSAGCQVLANLSDWDEFLALCHKQEAAGHGSSFTYTLLEFQG